MKFYKINSKTNPQFYHVNQKLVKFFYQFWLANSEYTSPEISEQNAAIVVQLLVEA